jgi:hypothetical protein
MKRIVQAGEMPHVVEGVGGGTGPG